ncbi:hypothetical protein MNV49_004013 [Pseudohyphozyma bogoriensis]|nr:hypothetical protein MNV49_004013 [Pseudohyphozyma bogoriensis]
MYDEDVAYTEREESRIVRACLSRMLDVFRDADPGFLRAAIAHHTRQLYAANQADVRGKGKGRRVVHADADEELMDRICARVSEKILDSNRGHYPRGVWQDARAAKLKPTRIPLEKRLSSFDEIKKTWDKAGVSRGFRKAAQDGRADHQEATRVYDGTLVRNQALVQLHIIFPQTRIERLREVVASLEHSHLFDAVDILLAESTNPTTTTQPATRYPWLPFFFRNATVAPPVDEGPPSLTPDDLFHSPTYINELSKHLQYDLSVPSNAISKYTRQMELGQLTYAQLRDDASRARGGQINRFFRWLPLRTNSNSSTNFQPPPSPSTSARVDITSPELAADIAAFEAPARAEQIQDDLSLARELNAEFTLEDQLFTCGCCYADVPFEDIATCASGDHTFCVDCVRRQCEEHAFGGAPLFLLDSKERVRRKGWEKYRLGVRCLSTEACLSAFSNAELERVLPSTLYGVLSSRISNAVLDNFLVINAEERKFDEKIMRCPFCSFAELVDGRVLRRAFPVFEDKVRFLPWERYLASLGYSILSWLILAPLYLIVTLTISFIPNTFYDHLEENTVRLGRDVGPPILLPFFEPMRLLDTAHNFITSRAKHVIAIKSGRANVFQCRNGSLGKPHSFGEEASTAKTNLELIERVWGEGAARRGTEATSSSRGGAGVQQLGSGTGECGKLSCLDCGKVYVHGLHQCLADGQDGLRLAVERAMSDASSRLISADAGAEQIVCRCGVATCYSCGKTIGTLEGYQHFCQHVRDPGSAGCPSCSKCSLWVNVDHQREAQAAAVAAREAWLQDHPESSPHLLNQTLNVVGPPTLSHQVRTFLTSATDLVLRQILI